MRIFEQDATRLLCTKIESIRHERTHWRCLHLKLSGMEARHNHTLRTNFILKGINNLLLGHEGYVYACQDTDIFILFQGRAKPITKKLAGYFADLDPDATRAHRNALFAMHDLAKDWLYVFVMAHRKLSREDHWENLGYMPPRHGQPFSASFEGA